MKVLMKLLCLCLLTGCTTNTIFVNQQNNQKKQWDYAIADSQYFNDAVFIGSSRMLGLRQNQRFQSAMFYTMQELSFDFLLTKKCIDSYGYSVTILDALKQQNFKKVYLDLGSDEVNWMSPSLFIDKYSQVIDEIQRIHPDAQIYIQSIVPLKTKQKEPPIERIECYNVLLKQLCQKNQIVYLDLVSALTGSHKYLDENMIYDEYHYRTQMNQKWIDYITQHVITK